MEYDKVKEWIKDTLKSLKLDFDTEINEVILVPIKDLTYQSL